LKNHYDTNYVPFSDRSQKEYQQTIKDLDKNDPKLAKIKVEYENKITAKADKLNEQIEIMTEKVERDSLSYDNQAGSFHSWSADYAFFNVIYEDDSVRANRRARIALKSLAIRCSFGGTVGPNFFAGCGPRRVT
jgi:hypothetical protein